MSRNISASEAKNRFGAVLKWVTEDGEDVIVESYGAPQVAIISFDDYQQMQELREQARRKQVLAQLQALADEVSAHNQDLSEEEAEALAERFVDEVVQDMIKEGKIKYEGQ